MNIRKIIANVICSVIPGKQRRGMVRDCIRSRISRKKVHVSLSDRNFANNFSIDDKSILTVLKSLGKFQ